MIKIKDFCCLLCFILCFAMKTLHRAEEILIIRTLFPNESSRQAALTAAVPLCLPWPGRSAFALPADKVANSTMATICKVRRQCLPNNAGFSKVGGNDDG